LEIKNLLPVRNQNSYGLLPKSFFAGSETFFNKSKARSRRFQNSPFGLNQLESLFFQFAKIYEQNSMSAQKDFRLGNNPSLG
jgi:hypothetical protein